MGGNTLGVLGSDVKVGLSDGTKIAYANLDYAASAPCLREVADVVGELLPYYASVHRGAGALSQLCTEKYELARESVTTFLGCRPDDEVVFTRNTTDALNLLAHVVPPDTAVITFEGEHHANLLPWSDVIRLPAPSSPEEAVSAVAKTLAVLGTWRPALLAVTGASNVTGEVWPLAELAAVARRSGARIAVDAAQLAPHRRIDVAALGLDYVAFSGHKLYAPFGTGVLAGRADWLDRARPYLAGGGATAHVGDAPGQVDWASGAARHEAGSPNVIGAVALAAACDALAAADLDALRSEEDTLTTRLHDGLAEIPAVRVLGDSGRWPDRLGIVSFTVDGVETRTVSTRLAAEFGIGVRDGLFCAHPFTRRLLEQAGATAPTAVRASIGIGTTKEHVDRLITGIRTIAGS
ncbi:aminotransferase class V-fold PLP-dependent enzyme [Amycolatopsis azurea]|uniref:Cysteine desulfurase n=1 Tax=Amycolatopsis azurea DSM 43854 TaxID=1238180 RepID=M2QKI9_9PSEU|nr:aminotransferase class V-fold PLP-dependent enzyme [Amycolatopsis azurea]EMD27221.1 Cysteine desulfurase [Amycolatopsis azurea DSM 43854]OOC03645.1 cysteine desulfurase [Amycolatopsis azurea DSM 43854]